MRGACTPSDTVFIDLRNAHPVIIICRYMRVRGLYPHLRASPVPTLIQPLLECEGPVPPSAGVVCTGPGRRNEALAEVLGVCTPFRKRRLYRTRKTLTQCSPPVAASVQGAHTPLYRRRLCQSLAKLIQVHNLSLPEYEGPEPLSAGTVCANFAVRFCNRCPSAFHHHIRPRLSSVLTLWAAQFCSQQVNN